MAPFGKAEGGDSFFCLIPCKLIVIFMPPGNIAQTIDLYSSTCGNLYRIDHPDRLYFQDLVALAQRLNSPPALVLYVRYPHVSTKDKQ